MAVPRTASAGSVLVSPGKQANTRRCMAGYRREICWGVEVDRTDICGKMRPSVKPSFREFVSIPFAHSDDDAALLTRTRRKQQALFCPM